MGPGASCDDRQGNMSKRVYCTYFDHNYLSRGLALYHSLVRHAPGARLWVLCLSDACYEALTALDLPDLVPRRLADFEAAEPEVAATRRNRSLIEYYFTCSPAWKLYVLNNDSGAEWVTYLDSDLFFFASPDPIYDEMGDASFGIIPHRFARGLEYRERFGIYNVGWVSVRRCVEGMVALRWWRERCIEWCHDFVDGDRFADQRYLDRLPGLFPNVHIIEHLGANLAPWNLANVRLDWRDEAVVIDDRYRLVFFHFHGVRRTGRYYFNSHRVFHAPFPKLVRERIYQPYITALAAAEREASPYLDHGPAVIVRPPALGKPLDHVFNVLRKARTMTYRGIDVVTRRAIAVPPSR
jgi:hypothetical protein